MQGLRLWRCRQIRDARVNSSEFHAVVNLYDANHGTPYHLDRKQVAKVGSKPALVSLYSKIAAKAFEPLGKESGEVSYETSLAQVYLLLGSRSAARDQSQHWQRR